MKYKSFPKEMPDKNYRIMLKREASKFKLTAEDLSNLTDLELMLPSWFFREVLTPNKLDKWYLDFFSRIQKITLGE